MAQINITLTDCLGSGMGSDTHCASPHPRKLMALHGFTAHNQNVIWNEKKLTARYYYTH